MSEAQERDEFAYRWAARVDEAMRSMTPADRLVYEARILLGRAWYAGRPSDATLARAGYALARLAGWRPAPPVLVQVTQTSCGCPSQWDALDARGRYYYLRYDGGTGEIRRYRTSEWTWSAKDELIRTVARFQYGGPLDGIITLDEFAARAGIAIRLDAARAGFWAHVADDLVLRGNTRLLDPDLD